MTKITTGQADTLWNDSTNSYRCTFSDSACDAYIFLSSLDGYQYQKTYLYSDGVIDGSTTDAAIKTQVKADLKLMDYQGTVDSPTITPVPK